MIENNPPSDQHSLDLHEQGVDGKSAKTDGKAGEKAAKAAARAAERDVKDADRIAKLHLDGDKLILRWLRTSLFLVTTGIAIDRVLSHLAHSQAAPTVDPNSALRFVALSLVVVGLVSLWLACFNHWQRLQAVGRGEAPPVPRHSLSLWASVAVAILSLVAFVSVLASYGAGQPLITP
jgi:uncharacterized membrane protein YidH (DUF202 family)